MTQHTPDTENLIDVYDELWESADQVAALLDAITDLINWGDKIGSGSTTASTLFYMAHEEAKGLKDQFKRVTVAAVREAAERREVEEAHNEAA